MPEFTAYAVTDKSSISPFGKRVVEYVKPFNERLDSIANSASNAIDVVNKKIVDKLYRENVSQKKRIYGEAVLNAMLGRDPGTITNKDFTEAELAALQQIVDNYMKGPNAIPLNTGHPLGSGLSEALGLGKKQKQDDNIYSISNAKQQHSLGRTREQQPEGKRYQFSYPDYGPYDLQKQREMWEWFNTLGQFGIKADGDKAIVYDKYNFDNEPTPQNRLGAKYLQPMHPLERFGHVVYDTWLAPEDQRNASAAGLAYIRNNGPKVRLEVPISGKDGFTPLAVVPSR